MIYSPTTLYEEGVTPITPRCCGYGKEYELAFVGSTGNWTTPVVHTASFLHPAVVHGVNDSAIPSSLQVIMDWVVQRAVWGWQTCGAGSIIFSLPMAAS